jgi:hypothetical protein
LTDCSLSLRSRTALVQHEIHGGGAAGGTVSPGKMDLLTSLLLPVVILMKDAYFEENLDIHVLNLFIITCPNVVTVL